MPTDDDDLRKAAELLELSRDDLLRKLTENLEPAFIGDLVREGKRIFQRTAENQREKVCKDKRVQAAFRDPSRNRRVLILCAIADALGTLGAMTIAALIVQDGLEAYCKVIWTPDAE